MFLVCSSCCIYVSCWFVIRFLLVRLVLYVLFTRVVLYTSLVYTFCLIYVSCLFGLSYICFFLVLFVLYMLLICALCLIHVYCFFVLSLLRFLFVHLALYRFTVDTFCLIYFCCLFCLFSRRVAFRFVLLFHLACVVLSVRSVVSSRRFGYILLDFHFRSFLIPMFWSLFVRFVLSIHVSACGNVRSGPLGKAGCERKFACGWGANDHLQVMRGLGYPKIWFWKNYCMKRVINDQNSAERVAKGKEEQADAKRQDKTNKQETYIT